MTLKYSFLFAILIAVTVRCSNQVRPEKKIVPVPEDSVLTGEHPVNLGDTAIPGKLNLRTAKKIEIISINKEMLKGDTTDKYYEKCKEWSLSVDQFKEVIREFKSMSGEMQYLSYLNMPCRMKGEIRIDGIEYKYWAYAGSTLTLKNKDTTLFFGCQGKKCRSFFLTGEISEKEMR